MHGLIALGTATGWVRRAARRRLHGSTGRRRPRRDPRAPRRRWSSCARRTTRPAPRWTLDTVSPRSARATAEVGGVVVVDEAYAEFRADRACRAPSTLLPECPRLVVTRTMSKAFALAGARVGYLAAAPAVVDALQLVRLPYHLSALTQAAARVALTLRATSCSASVEALREQRDRLARGAAARSAARSCPATPTSCSSGPRRSTRRVWQALLDHGVLVRDVGLPGWLRVTAGTAGGDGRVSVGALEDVSIRPSARMTPQVGEQRDQRHARRIERTTKESSVLVELELDGTGQADVRHRGPFYDHMVAQLGKHAGFDLRVVTKGDLDVDIHHTVEDTSLAHRHGAARGARRQVRDPPLRRRAGAARRGAGAAPRSTCPAGRTACTRSPRAWRR